MSFNDKVVLVSGASRGIGRAIAEAFVAKGAKVVGTATSQSGAEAISAYLGDAGCGLVLNVTSPESIESLFAAIKDFTVACPSEIIRAYRRIFGQLLSRSFY